MGKAERGFKWGKGREGLKERVRKGERGFKGESKKGGERV